MKLRYIILALVPILGFLGYSAERYVVQTDENYAIVGPPGLISSNAQSIATAVGPKLSINASNVTAGVFPIARLATGTPDGTKFVRDDGTLAVPAGGGGGSGTVTSVGASSSVSGLGFSGSPVTTSGTLSLTGTVAVASGGTGATDASGARTALSLVPGTDVQAYDADLDAIAALANAGIVVRTGAGTVAARTITGDSEISVTNGDGVSGNPTLAIGSAIARLASPAFTGAPTVPTASAGTSNTVAASTAYVDRAVASGGGGGGSNTVSSIGIVIDGGGAVIATGTKGFISVPYNCTISSARLLADQSGSIVIDVWKDAYANYPPTVADSITASAKPTLAAASKAEDTSLTGWSKTVLAGDVLAFNVDSASTVTRVTLQLTITR